MTATATGRLWLPFTQMQGFDRDRRSFVRGEGVYLHDRGGKRVFDAVSSIWTIVHGHCHPRIAEAIAHQARTLDHSTLLGATNPVAEELAQRLCTMTKMDYAFFSSDGASAVEVALKMALQYWQNAGEPQRTRFVHLTDSYHGDTAAAMSLSDISAFKSRFGAITFETLPFSASHIVAGSDVAAVIVEPIVQAAAGMQIVPRERYAALRDMTPLLIVDEIATGFGRTGTMFAHDQLDLRPDILALGKGITGGALALSATLVHESIYDAFLGEPGEMKQLFHGHSYAGNPIACAAALENIRIFDEEATMRRVEAASAHVTQALSSVARHAAVRDVRQAGLMCGVEIEPLHLPAPRGATAAWDIADALYERGHFTRPIGNVVQFVPPLVSGVGEIDAFFGALLEVLG